MSVLRVEGLTKNFGGLRAVDGVSFQVARGEILGIIGPNGAGKTTLFNLLNGILPADSGAAWLDGQGATLLDPERLRARVVAARAG